MKRSILALPVLLAACSPAADPPASNVTANVAEADDRSVVQYRCDGGVQLTARFDPDNGTVMILRGVTRLATLQQRRSGSGVWYRGQGYELRGKGEEVIFIQPNTPPLSCTAIVP